MNFSFLGLNTGYLGLAAAQEAIDTVGENITNANTPGYSRQTVTQIPISTFENVAMNSPTGGVLGGGTLVTQITRNRNQYLDTQYWQENTNLGEQQQLQQSVQQIEGVLGTTGSSSLSSQFNKFWADWQDLSVNPENPGVRASLVTDAQALASNIRQTYAALKQQQNDTDGQVTSTVQTLNQSVSNIAALNDQIRKAQAAGRPANTLMDQRGQAIEDLSQYLNVQTNDNSDGTVSVFVDGHALVAGSTAYPMQVLTNPTTSHVDIELTDKTVFTYQPAGYAAGTDTVSANYLGGQLKSLMNVRDNVIGQPLLSGGAPPGLLAQLDTLVRSAFGTSGAAPPPANVNAYQANGVDLNGAVNGDLFFVQQGLSTATNMDASNVDVNAALVANNTLVAAASPPAGANKQGDGSNALAIAQLQENTALVGGTTQDGYINTMLTNLGIQGQTAQTAVSNQKQILQNIDTLRQSESGVSLDEEMSDMIKYQHAYGAAAKVISTVDSMLNTLINNMT